MMCLTFGLFTQVSDSGPQGPLVFLFLSVLRELTLRLTTCTDTWGQGVSNFCILGHPDHDP